MGLADVRVAGSSRDSVHSVALKPARRRDNRRRGNSPSFRHRVGSRQGGAEHRERVEPRPTHTSRGASAPPPPPTVAVDARSRVTRRRRRRRDLLVRPARTRPRVRSRRRSRRRAGVPSPTSEVFETSMVSSSTSVPRRIHHESSAGSAGGLTVWASMNLWQFRLDDVDAFALGMSRTQARLRSVGEARGGGVFEGGRGELGVVAREECEVREEDGASAERARRGAPRGSSRAPRGDRGGRARGRARRGGRA